MLLEDLDLKRSNCVYMASNIVRFTADIMTPTHSIRLRLMGDQGKEEQPTATLLISHLR